MLGLGAVMLNRENHEPRIPQTRLFNVALGVGHLGAGRDPTERDRGDH
jgi:hypothetical protein